MAKMSLLVGGAVGFLLGSRAGTEPYEKVKAKAQDLRSDPRVQRKAQEAKDVAAQKKDEVQDKVEQKVQEASDDNTSATSTGRPTSPTGKHTSTPVNTDHNAEAGSVDPLAGPQDRLP